MHETGSMPETLPSKPPLFRYKLDLYNLKTLQINKEQSEILYHSLIAHSFGLA
jgi:hypothetical protein